MHTPMHAMRKRIRAATIGLAASSMILGNIVSVGAASTADTESTSDNAKSSSVQVQH